MSSLSLKNPSYMAVHVSVSIFEYYALSNYDEWHRVFSIKTHILNMAFRTENLYY